MSQAVKLFLICTPLTVAVSVPDCPESIITFITAEDNSGGIINLNVGYINLNVGYINLNAGYINLNAGYINLNAGY
jgi:hypothetical protein